MTADSRAQITAEIMTRTGIDDAMIELLVRSFYAKIQQDTLVGPVFAARIKDWEPHLQRMFAFWSSVALMSGSYHGQPMPVHMALPIDGRHFDRWLELFEETAKECCPPAAAEHFIWRARNIANGLEMGVAMGQGVLLRKGERFYRTEDDDELARNQS